MLVRSLLAFDITLSFSEKAAQLTSIVGCTFTKFIVHCFSCIHKINARFQTFLLHSTTSYTILIFYDLFTKQPFCHYLKKFISLCFCLLVSTTIHLHS